MQLHVVMLTFMVALLATSGQCMAFQKAYVTLLDGKSSILRGESRYVIKEGLALQAGDVIETAADAQSVIETSDGTTLGLSGDTRMLLLPETRRNYSTEVFILKGTVKITVTGSGKMFGAASQQMSLSLANGTAIAAVTPEESAVFAELGAVNIEHGGSPVKIRDREYCVIRPRQKVTIAASPPKDFIDRLPRMFFDDLPRRIDKFKERKIQLGTPQKFSYGEVESWLKSIPRVRKVVASLWKNKIHEPEFRNLLIRNMKAHPEWARIVFPDKNRE